MVQERALSARAVERVCKDIADVSVAGQPSLVDSTALEKQLAELKAQQKAETKATAKIELNGRSV
jgi:hypothetical protein